MSVPHACCHVHAPCTLGAYTRRRDDACRERTRPSDSTPAACHTPLSATGLPCCAILRSALMSTSCEQSQRTV
eukprot:scaffold291310_cov31-Tisochrysis_lutea.AAC.8